MFDKYLKDHLMMEDMSTVKDKEGLLTFDFFLKGYKTALIWSRIKFVERKKNMIWDRRLAYKAKDMVKYAQIV